MKSLLILSLLLGVASCAFPWGSPQNGGAAAVPATQGGGAGPQEGSPLNARNLGSGPTSTNGQ